ncbi:hypothetical protein K3495_g14047 [Podosphaera aphanis]|nr:hypothetical protein K3495_g14047 [Podosphaera aphanis]
MTSAYLISHIPKATHSWLSPLSKLRQPLGIPDSDEYNHLKAFGRTAYALDESIAKGDKIKLRAKKGFLELVPEDKSIPIIDFSIVPLSYGIVFDTENPLLRNSEPDSQENDDSNFKVETQVSLEEFKKLGDESKERNSLKVLAKNLHKPNDRAAIDPNKIISEKMTRKKTLKAREQEPDALVTSFNLFVIGRAKEIKRLHRFNLPPPRNWRKLKNHL